jgi:hypothetical protein
LATLADPIDERIDLREEAGSELGVFETCKRPTTHPHRQSAYRPPAGAATAPLLESVIQQLLRRWSRQAVTVASEQSCSLPNTSIPLLH